MKLTKEQLIEEANRCIDNQVLTNPVWHRNSITDYLKVSRIGASFTMNRLQRTQVAAQIHDYIHAAPKPSPVTPACYFIESLILSKQEKQEQYW